MIDNNTITIEICAASFSSALIAQEGGADRIELCAALELGGITPSFAVIELAKKALQIPVYVLIRPRGGDFCYSENEMQAMLRDIEICKTLAVDGIVCGALETNGTIHSQQLKRFLAASEGMDFTFHRAFDRCSNPFFALEQCIDFGVSRILTSGQQMNALQGSNFIAKLIEKAENKISIMPGAGISVDNILAIKSLTQAKEFHLSAKKTIQSPFLFENDMKDILDYDETDLEIVKKIVNLVKI
jgi:copper homeostasis protein